MLEPNLFPLFLRPLEDHDLAYMVTGSVASMVYGEPRLTHDIDLILRLTVKDATRLQHIFPLTDFYVPPVESLRLEIRRDIRGHFNLIHHQTGFKADIYLEGMDPMHQWAMENRKLFDFLGHEIWVAPPEYVIIRKLEFHAEGGSEKHLRDIAGMIQMGTLPQVEEVKKWLSHKSWTLLDKLLTENQ